jgi:hypothetical protein
MQVANLRRVAHASFDIQIQPPREPSETKPAAKKAADEPAGSVKPKTVGSGSAPGKRPEQVSLYS